MTINNVTSIGALLREAVFQAVANLQVYLDPDPPDSPLIAVIILVYFLNIFDGKLLLIPHLPLAFINIILIFW